MKKKSLIIVIMLLVIVMLSACTKISNEAKYSTTTDNSKQSDIPTEFKDSYCKLPEGKATITIKTYVESKNDYIMFAVSDDSTIFKNGNYQKKIEKSDATTAFSAKYLEELLAEMGMEATEENISAYLSMISEDYSLKDGFYAFSNKTDETTYIEFIKDSILANYYEIEEEVTGSATQYFKYSYFEIAEIPEEIDLTEYGNLLKYSEENKRFELDAEEALKTEYFDDVETVEYFNVYVENGLITKVEYKLSAEDMFATAEIIVTNECEDFDIPTDLYACAHDFGEDYSYDTFEDNYYHYKRCSNCGSIDNVEACKFEEDGHCAICGSEPVESIDYLLFEGEYIAGIDVNKLTNKISSLNYNYTFLNPSMPYDAFNLNVDSSLIDEEYEYVSSAISFLVNDKEAVLVGIENFETYESYYLFFTDFTVEENEEMYVISGTPEKIKIGDVYTK